MANSQLLGLQKESTSPQPRTYVPIAPPIKAPTIPIMIVTSQPPGSLPGWIAFAMAPAISPKIIQVKIPIV